MKTVKKIIGAVVAFSPMAMFAATPTVTDVASSTNAMGGVVFDNLVSFFPQVLPVLLVLALLLGAWSYIKGFIHF